MLQYAEYVHFYCLFQFCFYDNTSLIMHLFVCLILPDSPVTTNDFAISMATSILLDVKEAIGSSPLPTTDSPNQVWNGWNDS